MQVFCLISKLLGRFDKPRRVLQQQQPLVKFYKITSFSQQKILPTLFCLFLTESRLLFALITDVPTIQRLQCYPLQVSWLILLAPVVEPQQENDSRSAEQLVPYRDVTNNRRCPAHSYHQHTCHNMNHYHKNLVLVHNHNNH